MLVHNEGPVEISSQLHSRAGAKRPRLEMALIARSTAAMRVHAGVTKVKGLRSRCDRAGPATHHLPRSGHAWRGSWRSVDSRPATRHRAKDRSVLALMHVSPFET